ncbi:Carotenoid 9,10(9',10')-cleavage dioxygenase 1 [Fusarium oxysporum f. sp. cubense race 1]|uniref:Carotenoid 9,10(9',10')-cleavage dioxygenase 1 n=1 Tax=Fusarium oxysporum f. sp. cubense (strain race 1) TaxID=1229664 RepID=N4U6H8_FUSC1|nr:Carotenoid 9,10(9',10')-cleavage dioxygenase 1 [Fusarium oxysporum f. sp. cubense race 1]
MKFLQQNSLTQTSMSQPDENISPPLRHPYLTGNFAPIHQKTNLTPCTYSGCIPPELTGGQTIFLVILSNLPGSQQAIKRISVANTAVLYHDGRALATCESGPPMRIQLPSLDTVGWFDGVRAEGEAKTSPANNSDSPFGGSGLFSFMKEWTTGHPKVDPITGEMLLYHNTFMPPYLHYSVLPKSRNIRPPVRFKSTRVRDWSDDKKEKACRYKEAPALESPGEATGLTDYFPTAESDDYDQCRLYYYEFDMATKSQNKVKSQWALSAIPFEFPSVRPDREMQEARYIYGCSTSTSCFGIALGRADKVDLLVKVDAKTLIQRGKINTTPVTGCVDRRSVSEILEEQKKDDPINIFRLPPNHYAQEPRFVPRDSSTAEDDGYLLFYVFDESQLLPSGDCPPSAISELWILNAKNMRDVVAKVTLPQRVPYGLHGTWFSRMDIKGQRAVESLRSLDEVQRKKEEWVNSGGQVRKAWMVLRGKLERAVG